MDEHKVLKERFNKLNQLLDKLDERLATGEMGEAKYKELAEKYKAEAENLKNQIAEKELLHEVGLKAEEKGESVKEDTLVYTAQPVYQKNATLAAFLSFFFMGLGQIYCGKWKRGTAIIGLGFLLGIAAFVEFETADPSEDLTASFILFILFLLLVLPYDIILGIATVFDERWHVFPPLLFLIFLGIWNVFDAHNLAKKI